jgi:3-methyladenine DNA glycosylase AlkC
MWGAVAQLGERRVRNAKVGSSILLRSTRKMAQKVLLKDLLFNAGKVQWLAAQIQRVYPQFENHHFVDAVTARLNQLELKARITWIAECLKDCLPSEYSRAVSILVESLPAPNNPDLTDNDFGDFIYAAYAEFVALYGCTKPHLQASLAALYQITQRFSAEYAIRHFLNAFPQETLYELQLWTQAQHYHVRRLCSEGTRPKLPWGQKLKIPITAPLPLLDALFADSTRFVTRSVANHINDVSKINPELVLKTLMRWRKSGLQQPAEMDYIIRHALRTLAKSGNVAALKLLGFAHTPHLAVKNFIASKKVIMNSALEFSFTIQAPEEMQVLVDYILHFRNKLGKLTGRKVFKIGTFRVKQNTPLVISKRHMLREHMTTRTLYPGEHEIQLQVNGRIVAEQRFKLVTLRSASPL